MGPEVGAVDRDKSFAQFAHGGLAGGLGLALGHHYAQGFFVLIDQPHRRGSRSSGLPIPCMPIASRRTPNCGTSLITASADDVAPARVPSWELDRGRLTDHAPSSVAADEILSRVWRRLRVARCRHRRGLA